MTPAFTTVREHYQAAINDTPAMLADVAQRLDRIEGPLTAEAAARFDQFHVGGLPATAELARRVRLEPGMRVLDAGSGLGGPSRYLAETFGVEVDGVDLAPAYVEVARLLAERSGLGERVRYREGSITDLPFDGASFDLVWTQHVVMNIADRAGLYRELRRVLRPGGTLAFYDPYAPEDGVPPLYPTPWAQDPSQSTLLTQRQTVWTLETAGFAVAAWDDVTSLGLQWIAAQAQAQATSGALDPKALSPALIVGARMGPMVANFARNLAEGRVRLVMGMAKARVS